MAKKSTNKSTKLTFDEVKGYLPAAIVFLIYMILAWDHGYVLDDGLVITTNEYIKEGFGGIKSILTTNYAHGHQGLGFNDGLYRPLSLVTFALEYAIAGFSPVLSHFIQAVLYALCVFFLFRWLNVLIGKESIWPFWICMLFALHPIHTEVVANIKSRDEIMAFLFLMLSLIQLHKWIESKTNKYLVFSLLWFTVSLFSKESAVTYLAIFPLVFWKKEIELNESLKMMGLFLIPTVLFLGVRFTVLSSVGPVDEGITSLLQNSLIQGDGFLDRLSGAAYIQVMYVAKLFFPFELTHDYSYNAVPFYEWTSLGGIASILAVAAMLGTGVYGLINKKWYGFGIMFYFFTVSAVSNVFVLIGATAAERFLFTPSLGWCFVAVAILTSTPYLRKWSIQTLGLYSLVFITLTGIRIPEWKSNFTLFEADVEKVSNSARAHYNIGSELIERAKDFPAQKSALLQDARRHLIEAIEIYPDYQDAHNNLGLAFMEDGRYEEAIVAYQDLIRKFPEYSKARFNLANAALNHQNFALAEKNYEAYYQMNPNMLDALFRAADCEGRQGKFGEAAEHLLQLTKLEPNRNRGWLMLGLAYANMNRLQEAEQALLNALRITPNDEDANLNLAMIYLNTNRGNEAADLLRKVLTINPNNQRAAQILSSLQQANP